MSQNYKIFSHLDDVLDSYKEPVSRVDGLVRRPKDIIRTVEFYSNNQYLSGNTDSLGREKPFYNVGNYRVTVAKTATDLDVKDIKFEPDSLKHSVQAMLYNKELYKFLKDSNFSLTLNEMGLVRPKYGGVLVKKSMVDGKLKIDVMDWVNVDFDPADVLGGTLVETFYLSPSELSAKSDTWYDVGDVLEAHNKLNKNKPAKIEVKEVSGDFPINFYPDEEDNDSNEYKRMCFYIACVGKKKYLLYAEYEKGDKYKYLPWEAVGKSLGRGVWEDGFESQTWQNDAMISMKNVMDISGKVIISTDSQKVSGNAITGVDNGHIFQIEAGRSIQSLNLAPSALPQFERVIELWNNQFDRVASTYDANTGEAPTAGTPYSQTALLNQVANSPFEFRREEWGIFLNEILNDWVLPYLKKQILKGHTLVSDYTDDELDIIDEAVATYEGNLFVKDSILEKGEVPTPDELEMVRNGVRNGLNKNGKKREIEIPEGFLDVKGKLTANITGELKNKSAILQSLDSIFKTVVSTYNPQTGQYSALQDKTLNQIFNQIVEMSGIPLSSAQLRPTQTSPVQPTDLSAVEPVK